MQEKSTLLCLVGETVIGRLYGKLTLTHSKISKDYKRELRKCAKFNYVTEWGFMGTKWLPGSRNLSDTWVACCGWTVVCDSGGSQFEPRGNSNISTPPFPRKRGLEVKVTGWPEAEMQSVGRKLKCNLKAADIDEETWEKNAKNWPLWRKIRDASVTVERKRKKKYAYLEGWRERPPSNPTKTVFIETDGQPMRCDNGNYVANYTGGRSFQNSKISKKNAENGSPTRESSILFLSVSCTSLSTKDISLTAQ